jgi:hypothetical protein
MFPNVPMGDVEWIIMMMMNRATRSRSRLSADYEANLLVTRAAVMLLRASRRGFTERLHGEVRMRLKARLVSWR